ncbi:MAG: hypothetical protein KAT65_11360 [Methanophagales archaeon]|nr:hypothetical protein [Methanophagales archaeon]
MAKNHYRDYHKKHHKNDYIKYTSGKFLLSIFLFSFFFAFIMSPISHIIGRGFDILASIVFLILVAKVVWFYMRKVDGFDVESDLGCWGLRIIGGILFFVGMGISFISLFVWLLSLQYPVFFLFSLLLMFPFMGLGMSILGVFAEFRSYRRYPFMHVKMVQ